VTINDDVITIDEARTVTLESCAAVDNIVGSDNIWEKLGKPSIIDNKLIVDKLGLLYKMQ